jgi:hypothetical protein
MTDAPNQSELPSSPPAPVVREGEHEGAVYRIETWHEPEEL